ncbi:MAG: MOSC domain-containing protein [Deinococcota bacterium]|nr:MOSC domain-containing protein [Deinococcota bacterium]
MTGEIVSLHAGGQGLAKEGAPSLVLVEGYGARGDRHAGRDRDRAVLITPASSYLYIARAGILLRYGMLGENLVLAGLDPHQLPSGSRLRLGDAVLELTTACTVCSSLSSIDLRLPKLAYDRRGVYARVVAGGRVHRGQAVTVTTALASPAQAPPDS